MFLIIFLMASICILLNLYSKADPHLLAAIFIGFAGSSRYFFVRKNEQNKLLHEKKIKTYESFMPFLSHKYAVECHKMFFIASTGVINVLNKLNKYRNSTVDNKDVNASEIELVNELLLEMRQDMGLDNRHILSVDSKKFVWTTSDYYSPN